ncbi:hypothetical protein [Pseudoalteromonas sp. S4389]|uniref:hypothetical protein n=1 Tax=Pseudoalteromonas sp. S4389 TaxID=579556 RepID=UPI0014865684|nr:hypothetical protein [Pseudoalteromonas sp. S4389]
MGFFDMFDDKKDSNSDLRMGAIDSGRNKITGGHDHRTSRGDDRTPAQKEGDKKRRKHN